MKKELIEAIKKFNSTEGKKDFYIEKDFCVHGYYEGKIYILQGTMSNQQTVIEYKGGEMFRGLHNIETFELKTGKRIYKSLLQFTLTDGTKITLLAMKMPV